MEFRGKKLKLKIIFKRQMEHLKLLSIGIVISMETAARNTIELQSGVKTNENKLAITYRQRGTAGNELYYDCGKDSRISTQYGFKRKTCRKCSTMRYSTGEQTDEQAFKTTKSMLLVENMIIKLKGRCKL